MVNRLFIEKAAAVLALALVGALPGPVSGASHALIMAIDAYEGPEPLPGVALDVPMAAEIARRMGVPQENTIVRRNRQLTLTGIRTSLNDLLARIEQGDHVFLYYSGHGARIANPRARSGCTEAMVTVNGELLLDIELEQWIARLGQKAGQFVFMNDSCHAGGAVTRDVRFRPKFYKARGSSECTDPVNVSVRSAFKATQPSRSGPNVVGAVESRSGPQAGSGARQGPNVMPGAQSAPDAQPAPRAQSATGPQPAPAPQTFLGPQAVYIAAAKEDEVAFASPEGSVATMAWAACMRASASERGQSAALTAAQLRACAQSRIDQNLKLPRQNITIVGSDQSSVLLRSERR